ncbi:MAG TPA: A24 family peptidase [Chloroflexia bacterium]|nr:A24 family peptidase [Chloroflexia bacterium]
MTDRWLLALELVLTTILGLGLGSSVATVAARLSLGRPVWAPPYCVRTGQHLPWADAAPLVGYWRRRGHCRACGMRLARWWPLTEASMALLAVLAYLSADGWNPRFALYLVDLAVLLAILVMDWRRHEIYTVVLLAGAVAGLVGGALLPEITLAGAGWGALIGGGLMLVIYGFGRLLGRLLYGREGLAWGDVELAAMLGLMAGFPGVVTPLFWGPVVGVVLFLRRGLGTYFPFAPGLCIVTMAFLLLHTGDTPLWGVLRLPYLGNIVYFIGKVIWDLTRKALQIG